MTIVKKPWTDEEIKLLKAMATMLTVGQMSERLNRSVSSIKFKLSSLNIKLRDRGYIYATKPNEWTENELKILKKYAGVLTAHEIAEVLKTRTWKAVRLKAASLGITLYKTPWSYEEMTRLIELREQGLTFGQIAIKMGRSSAVCAAKYRYLTRK
jgi:hypothetical protein